MSKRQWTAGSLVTELPEHGGCESNRTQRASWRLRSLVLAAIVGYAFAMVAANLLVLRYGPGIATLNAFAFIGLDLALRDWLHVHLTKGRMLLLIASAGLATYSLNPAAQFIAIASAVSFTASSLADWSVFATVRGTWLKRSTASNVVGALVDSFLFPTLAFGAFMPEVVLKQFLAKTLGGAIWAGAIARFMRHNESQAPVQDRIEPANWVGGVRQRDGGSGT